MATVQVLCPNGRRQTVKITPNSKLLQVLEEVCQKQGFLPSTDYKLMHGRTKVDLSLAFRYANLSNNVRLELVKSEESRAEEEVLIALQLENGERFQSKFSPSTSLWDVLKHFENQPDSAYRNKLTVVDSSKKPAVHPVCIYMREEIVGQMAIQMTSLRHLGLTGGKAVIRLVWRGVEDRDLAEIMHRLEKEKAKQTRLEQIASRKLAEERKNIQTDSRTGTKNELMQVDTPSSECAEKSRMECQTSDNTEQMEIELTANACAVSSSVSSEAAVGFASRAAERRTGSQSLKNINIPAMDIIAAEEFSDLTPEQQRIPDHVPDSVPELESDLTETAEMESEEEIAQRLAQRIMPHIDGSTSPSPCSSRQSSAKSKYQSETQQPQFVEFKFPESTKGKTLYSNEYTDVSREDFKPCPREAVLYNLDEPIAHTSSSDDLPDDFFEVTESDLKKMLVDQQKKTAEVLEAPLMTQAMRQQRLEEHYGRYEKVVIRVQFPDRLVLQGLFSPRERVSAIYKFVKEFLQDKSLSFYLYTTPPKCVLNQKSTIIEARLVPATIVYFGAEPHKDHYLSEKARSQTMSRNVAEKVAFSSLPKTHEYSAADSTSVETLQEMGDNSKYQASGKKPKWLKLGKK